MPKITLENGKEVIISQESYDALAEAVKPVKDWRAEKGDYYYYVDDLGEVDGDEEEVYDSDDYRYTTGNYFQTKEEAEAYRDEQLANGPRNKAIRRVNARIKELNDGWVADWSDTDQKKFTIYWASAVKDFSVTYDDDIFCLSLSYIKSQEIANQIIDEMRDDLLVILGEE